MQTKGQAADRYEQLIASIRVRDERRRRLSSLVRAIQNRTEFRNALRAVGAAA